MKTETPHEAAACSCVLGAAFTSFVRLYEEPHFTDRFGTSYPRRTAQPWLGGSLADFRGSRGTGTRSDGGWPRAR